MKVYSDIHSLPAFNNAVITIGTFDGVHEGHKEILKSVVAHANAINGHSILITFEPHPRKLLAPQEPIKLLTTLDEKLKLIEESGISATVVVPFTRSFSELSAEQYISEFLVNKFHPHSIIIGYDHRFGHDRSGDIGLLKKMSGEYHFEVSEIPAQLIAAAAVSSTQVRNALQDGRVEEAAVMLGRRYKVAGTVVHGAKRGRTIGYPTANIEPVSNEKLIPGIGVYAVYVRLDDQEYGGMLSIGYNPTVTDEKIIRIEVNIFNFDQDIYGHHLELEFVKRLRDEEKFPSLEALMAQLKEDQDNALLVLQ